jgi:hypothetical protein
VHNGDAGVSGFVGNQPFTGKLGEPSLNVGYAKANLTLHAKDGLCLYSGLKTGLLHATDANASLQQGDARTLMLEMMQIMVTTQTKPSVAVPLNIGFISTPRKTYVHTLERCAQADGEGSF